METNAPSKLPITWFTVDQIGVLTWGKLKAKLTGIKSQFGNYFSHVNISESDADKLIENIKKSGRYPVLDDESGDNLETYENWLVDTYLKSASTEYKSEGNIDKEKKNESIKVESKKDSSPPLYESVGEKDLVEEEKNKSTEVESKKESILALYEGVREGDLVDENIDERILRILGLEDVFDLDYGTYLSLLKEKLVTVSMGDNKIPREEQILLQDEFKRVKGNVGRFKIKRKKITAENIGVTGPVRVSSEKFYLTSKAIIPEPAISSAESSEDIKDISGAIDKILKSLTEQNKLTKKKADEDRKSDEQRKRTKREADLEKPIQKAAALVKKIIAPFQSILDRIMRFIQFTLLGYFVDKILKWFSDPANEKKIKVLGRFLKDWWPALLTAYGLFATPFGLFVRSTLKMLRGILPQMAKFIAANRWLSLYTVAAIGAAAKIKESERMKPLTEKSQEDINKTLQSKEAPWYQKLGASFAEQSLNAPGGPVNPIGLSSPSAMYNGGGLVKGNMISNSGRLKRRSFFGGGEIQKELNVNQIAYDGGGGIDNDSGLRITGAGPDTQLIAAAPGEVVMSKKAVDKYGANFFLGLNKRAGGTNVPRMVNNIQLAQGGGIVRKVINSFYGGGMVQNTNNSFQGGGSVYNTTNSFQGGRTVHNTNNSFQGGGIPQKIINSFQGGGIVQNTTNSYQGGGFGNLLNRLGSMGLPGTGRVVAPRGSQMGFQNKLLGIPLNRSTINQQEGQRLSPKVVQRYNQNPSAPSVIKPWSPYDSTQVSFPKSISTPQSSGGLNLNLKQNVQTIQGATQKQEQMMRQMGVKPSGYVNLRGQPINLGPQSRLTAPGIPVISSKTQMIVLPPTTSVAQKPPTPTISGTKIPEFSIVANTGHRSMISDALGIADLVG